MLSLVLVSFGLIALIWIGLRHAGGASPDSSAVALSLAGRVVVDSVGMRMGIADAANTVRPPLLTYAGVGNTAAVCRVGGLWQVVVAIVGHGGYLSGAPGSALVASFAVVDDMTLVVAVVESCC